MSTKNRLIAHQILAEKRRRQGVQKAINRVLQGPKDLRYKRIPVLQDLAAEGFIEAKAALQTLYAEDNRHWGEWQNDPLPEIDPYTGADDDAGYVVIGPDQYLEFAIPEEEGGGVERIGYSELRWLMDILEDRESVQSRELTERRFKDGSLISERVYTPEEASSLIRSGMGPYADEPEDLPLEDRGYIPPTFETPLDLNWGDVQAYIVEHEDFLADEARAISNTLMAAGITVWLEARPLLEKLQRVNDYLDQAGWKARFREAIEDRKNLTNALIALSQIQPPTITAPTLCARLQASELAPAEQLAVIRNVVGRIRQRIPARNLKDIERHGYRSQQWYKYRYLLRFHEYVEQIVDASHLAQFAELFADELDLSDAPGPTGETPPWIIEREADQALETILAAPIIRLPRKKLETLWATNRKAFPAPEQVRSSTRRNVTSFWLVDQADWRTLQKLYQLAGIEIEGAAIHSHTPFFQRCAIEKIAAGIPTHIAYKQTWAEYRQKLAERRAQPAKPKPAQNTVEITGFNPEKQRFIGEAHGKPVLLHPNALDKAPIALTERTLRVLQKFVEQYPSAKKLVLKAQPT